MLNILSIITQLVIGVQTDDRIADLSTLINPVLPADAPHRWYWGECARTGDPAYHWTHPLRNPTSLPNFISIDSPADRAWFARIMQEGATNPEDNHATYADVGYSTALW